MNFSLFNLMRQILGSLCRILIQPLRRWTKPDNHAPIPNAALDLTRSKVVGCFIGPNDLALSMGAAETGPGTEHEAAMQEVLRIAKKVGKAPGKHCGSGAEVTERIAQGFQFLALSSDAGLMAKAARAEFGAIDFTGGSGGSARKGDGSLYE